MRQQLQQNGQLQVDAQTVLPAPPALRKRPNPTRWTGLNRFVQLSWHG